jgi:hypothetical protein
MLLQPFMIIVLALPINGERGCCGKEVLIGQRTHVARHRDRSR